MPENLNTESNEPQASLLEIFWTYLSLGCTAFGGPAMVPYIGDVAVRRKKWMTQQTFKEGVAVAQMIPGATAMQTAAYVGLRVRGIAGAAAAFIGFGLPAFCLMIILSVIYTATHKSPISVSVFSGLQVIVVAIVAKAVYSFASTTIKNFWDVVLATSSAVYLGFKGNPVVAIFGGAALGILVYRKVVRTDAEPKQTDGSLVRSTTRSVLKILFVGALIVCALFFIDRRLFDLALLMLRIDVLAFGGGFASVPIMLHSVVEVNRWMDTRAFMDGIAMGQVTPGPIVITATFVGYQLAHFPGAVVATLAIFFPSFVLMVLVVPHFDRLKHNKYFQMAIRGVLAVFVGLLLSVAIRFGVAVPWSPVLIILGAIAFIALMLDVNVIWVVIPAAVFSVFLLR